MSPIPIQNIYYLLSYAWNLLDEAEELKVETEELPQVTDLLARLLIVGTQRLLRRGIDRGYLAQTEILNTLRGRVDFGASVRRLLFEQCKAQCDFEEFLPELLHNRILKTSIQTLADVKGLALPQRQGLHTLLRRMEGISPLRLRKAHFTEVRLHRNNAHYRLPMHLCELVYDNLLVNEQTGQRCFRNFLQDEYQMRKLFESFVANFYRKETDWNVTTQEKIHWDTCAPNILLPQMNADAVLRCSERTVVVECKFYPKALQTGRWEKLTIHSPHLYQLLTYMTNLRKRTPEDCRLDGVLIYPAVNTHLCEDFILSGNQIKVCTVDLDKDWPQVSAQMKEIVESKIQ
jgi:5-methylcytosine-specific restriction enzyme subunit McrC